MKLIDCSADLRDALDIVSIDFLNFVSALHIISGSIFQGALPCSETSLMSAASRIYEAMGGTSQ
jgi:hypothetical protein